MMNGNLFNKDIQKVNLLIDTQDLTPDGSTRSHSNYVIKFDDDGTNNSAGFGGVYRNVIGLRLKSAIIRHDPIVLDASNGQINNTTINTVYLLKSKYGNYTGSGIATLFRTAANFTTNSDAETVAVPGSDPLPSCAFDSVSQKLTFTSRDYNFDLNNQTRNLARMLGFDKTFSGSATSSTFPIDITSHFVDVVVDELPYIACKQNAAGRKIIDRIPITTPVGGIQSYKVDPAELQTQNYFTPITLSRLSIQLYTDKDNQVKSSDEQHSLEFEITMLKNNTFR